MSATELAGSHKTSISRDIWKYIEICKGIQIADSFLNTSGPTMLFEKFSSD